MYILHLPCPCLECAQIGTSVSQGGCLAGSTLVPAPRALYGSFAHWGGSYYYFYSSDEFTPSSIARYTPGKGMKVIVKDAGRILYGSSVSTCAPTSNPDIK